jgi:hypothetical protein
MLVDGEGLADPKRRHAVLHDGRILCRAITEKQLVKGAARLQVVVTKWDLIDAAGIPRDELTAEVEHSILSGVAASHDARVLITAARPRPPKVPWALGCAALLESWLTPIIVGPPVVGLAPRSERQFDMFGRSASAVVP